MPHEFNPWQGSSTVSTVNAFSSLLKAKSHLNISSTFFKPWPQFLFVWKQKLIKYHHMSSVDQKSFSRDDNDGTFKTAEWSASHTIEFPKAVANNKKIFSNVTHQSTKVHVCAFVSTYLHFTTKISFCIMTLKTVLNQSITKLLENIKYAGSNENMKKK